MTTTQIPPGTYRIVVAPRVGLEAEVAEGGIEAEGGLSPRPEFLTNARWVTIEPGPKPQQEWRLVHRNKDWIIELNSKEFPPKYITYNGAPAKPKDGARIELRVSGFPGPLSAWHFKPVSKGKHTYTIVIAGSEESEKFGIAIGPQKIYPPFLVLSSDPKSHVAWNFAKLPLLADE